MITVNFSLVFQSSLPRTGPVEAFGLENLKLNVDAVLPLDVRNPIHQAVHVRGGVTGRVRQTITGPVSERIEVPRSSCRPPSGALGVFLGE